VAAGRLPGAVPYLLGFSDLHPDRHATGRGQIKCAGIRTDNQFFYFDLRPFDARSGRVAMQDSRNLKTNAAGRVIPIHPLLIE